MKEDFGKQENLNPGEFRESKGPIPKPAEKERLPEVSERLVRYLAAFKDQFKPKADVVYYPACATETSISKVFPESRVIYADIDKQAVAVLQKAGFEAHAVSALEFKPDKPVDVLLMLNPSIGPDIPLTTMAEEGFMLCNDYHGTATTMRTRPDYELVGTARVQNRRVVLETEHLEDYWKEITTDDEFKNAPLSFGAVDYRTASRVVERLTGEKANILEKYKQIIALARAQTRARQEALLKSDPELAALKVHDEDDSPLQYQSEEGEEFIDTRLPRKRGTVDDLFVFRKRVLVK